MAVLATVQGGGTLHPLPDPVLDVLRPVPRPRRFLPLVLVKRGQVHLWPLDKFWGVWGTFPSVYGHVSGGL